MKAWIEAFRLRTLPLAIACVGMGAVLARDNGHWSLTIFVLTIATTILLQILSNLANDYGDSIHGADSVDRQGPSRAVQSGVISKEHMKKAMYICGVLAFTSGVGLLLASFGDNLKLLFIFLGLGVAAIFAAVNYTAGSNPYGYKGFGDVFVLLFFGYVGVAGTYFLFAENIPFDILLPATSCGLLATGVLNVNNIRDIDSDLKAGKYSIPVRIGRKKSIIYHSFLLFGAIICAALYTFLNYQGPWQWLFVLVIPLLGRNLYAVSTITDPKHLDPYLKQLAASTLVFVILFGVGLLYS
ncbi:1,4-dihydroxy-2-naphthoate polyprenyltransferase [Marinigracilibium pacificum]|uniref:1,4-dihydroxy-2-naphthoate octaprenyltransferase n=1 Tax=Marinigracilibium pacificum TaxID=2729599 RepID=A0A848J714_9BACT|nr:1,4-dihydroxy-2-naphthoate polyprenyltransferase [Marinigracilibium pacificum]NMM50234.1 1,4-dihydroxy-2-naphthoate polyprenyltransferase [Marinigracilibium pacificum]